MLLKSFGLHFQRDCGYILWMKCRDKIIYDFLVSVFLGNLCTKIIKNLSIFTSYSKIKGAFLRQTVLLFLTYIKTQKA